MELFLTDCRESMAIWWELFRIRLMGNQANETKRSFFDEFLQKLINRSMNGVLGGRKFV